MYDVVVCAYTHGHTHTLSCAYARAHPHPHPHPRGVRSSAQRTTLALRAFVAVAWRRRGERRRQGQGQCVGEVVGTSTGVHVSSALATLLTSGETCRRGGTRTSECHSGVRASLTPPRRSTPQGMPQYGRTCVRTPSAVSPAYFWSSPPAVGGQYSRNLSSLHSSKFIQTSCR